MITKYNIAKPIEYEKGGEKKTYWANVGTMTEFEKDGKISRIIEIPAIGLKANVFDIKPVEPSAPQNNSNAGDNPF